MKNEISPSKLPWPIIDENQSSLADSNKEYCQLVPIENAMARPGFAPNTWFLFVSGNSPCANMSVQLVPVEYVDKPNYWEICAVGCVDGLCAEAVTPYLVWTDISQSIGHKGVEIRGSNKTIRVKIP